MVEAAKSMGGLYGIIDASVVLDRASRSRILPYAWLEIQSPIIPRSSTDF